MACKCALSLYRNMHSSNYQEVITSDEVQFGSATHDFFKSVHMSAVSCMEGCPSMSKWALFGRLAKSWVEDLPFWPLFFI
jgi:hypothetical protein